MARDGDLAGRSEALEVLPAVAREAIRARLEDREPRLPGDVAGALSVAAAVFVTIRLGRALRGCVGSTRPRYADVVQETANRAVLAAFEDPRFPPLIAAELEGATIEVSVLGPTEPVASLGQLDPARFGVVVAVDGGRRGVLLPEVEGIDTPEQQVALARRKGEIADDEDIRLERFSVAKFVEPAGG